MVTDQRPRGYLLGGPDDPDKPRRYATGFAVCERCGDRALIAGEMGKRKPKQVLAALVEAEIRHALKGCNGCLRLEEPTLEEIEPPSAPALGMKPEPPGLRIVRD